MKWFSWRGSDTRSDFWICQLTLGVLVLVAAVFIEEQKAWTPIALIAIVLGFMSMARRFKDMGVSPWWTVATFIPLVGFILFLAAGLKPSKPADENPYLDDMKPNEKDTKPDLTKSGWNE